MSEEAKKHYYSVYLSQNGSNVTALLDKAACDELFAAIYAHGVPVGLWTTYDSRSLGIIVNPRRGGVVLNMDPAQPLPHDGNGNFLSPAEVPVFQQQGGQLHYVQPEEQRKGQVVYPQWGDEEADHREAMGALAAIFNERGPIASGPDTPPAPTPNGGNGAPPPPGPGGLHEQARDGRTAYQLIQEEARELGIRPLNQSAADLQAAIDRVRAGNGNAAPPPA